MVIRHDDLEPQGPRRSDLLDRGDPTVDGDDEPASLFGETREGLARYPVSLVEAAREMPRNVGPELAQCQDGERGGADAVRVVVAVDADRLPGGDRAPDRLARRGHVSEPEGVVQRLLPGQEGPRLLGVAVS